MGYNTTVVVLNDALGEIRDDAEFGRRLYDAIVQAQRGRPVDVAAHGKHSIHANAATVIETHHADYDVTVVVGGNTGRVIRTGQGDVERWQPIETAPKGGGAELTTDPAWVEPPLILLAFPDGEQAVCHWDWYYAEDGNGYAPGVSAWVEPTSAEQAATHYGEPIAWKPLDPFGQQQEGQG